MADVETLKDLLKPPFATYDVVVYFGCGLFALPFARHYLGEPATSSLKFNFGFQPDFANVVLTTLVLLVTVYIIGHIIAYVSGILVEKTMDAFFGKTSTVLLVASRGPHGGPNSVFRGLLLDGFLGSFKQSVTTSLFRLFFHIPALLSYGIIIAFGTFGFYRSRVPTSVIDLAKSRFEKVGLQKDDIAVDKQWFKPLEAVVMNTNPTATARMYNYLVISGLFRSLSLIFLASLWFEAAYLMIRIVHRCPPSGLLMLGQESLFGQFTSFVLVNVIYVFCLFSFLKFKRRYVEDAVFAFVFAP
jgi:hypothetical protein